MISFKICRKCEFMKEYHPDETDDAGRIKVFPHVICSMVEFDGMLYMNDECPERCKYFLEQKLFTQKIPPEMADSLSGGKQR